MTTIRDYCPTDLEKTAAVWLTSTIKGQAFLPQEHWLALYRTIYHKLLPFDWETFLAQENDQIEGMLSFSAPGQIAALFVGPSCQHKGHAGALLGFAKEKFDRLEAWVYTLNESALHFFEKNGFAIVSEELEPDTGLTKKLLVWQRTAQIK